MTFALLVVVSMIDSSAWAQPKAKIAYGTSRDNNTAARAVVDEIAETLCSLDVARIHNRWYWFQLVHVDS